jgi:hypothetical protein
MAFQTNALHTFQEGHWFIWHTYLTTARLATGWTIGVRFTVGAGSLSLLHRVQTGSGLHPASYSMGTGGSFPGGKAAGAEADHSTPSSSEVKNAWCYTSIPNTSLWHDA